MRWWCCPVAARVHCLQGCRDLPVSVSARVCLPLWPRDSCSGVRRCFPTVCASRCREQTRAVVQVVWAEVLAQMAVLSSQQVAPVLVLVLVQVLVLVLVQVQVQVQVRVEMRVAASQ